MRKLLQVVTLFALIAILAAPLSAAEKEKKKGKGKGKGRNAVAAQLMKKLADADITDEQEAKIKEIVGKHKEKIQAAQKELAALMTPELRKKRAEAAKKARADGLKGKEAQQAVADALGLTGEQKEAMQKAQANLRECTQQLNKDVVAVLTPEQREKAGLKGRKGKGKGKGKKKKKDDA